MHEQINQTPPVPPGTGGAFCLGILWDGPAYTSHSEGNKTHRSVDGYADILE